MVPFACWVREQILCRPDVIVVENVQPFPAEELELIFAREYTLAAVCLSPDQLGVPCTCHRLRPAPGAASQAFWWSLSLARHDLLGGPC